jgi:hypothetical protein
MSEASEIEIYRSVQFAIIDGGVEGVPCISITNNVSGRQEDVASRSSSSVEQLCHQIEIETVYNMYRVKLAADAFGPSLLCNARYFQVRARP